MRGPRTRSRLLSVARSLWPSRVPLAWLNLTRSKPRFVLSLAGVAFAVLLMFMEIGFYHALFDSTVALIQQLDADLVILSKAKDTFTVQEPFPRQRLNQARSVPGVESATALYMERQVSIWRAPDPAPDQRTRKRPIRVLAYNPRDQVLLDERIRRLAPRLEELDTVLFDDKSKPIYGDHRQGVVAELAGREVQVVGSFHLGTDFTNDGTVIMSDRTYAKLFTNPLLRPFPLREVEVGLLKLDKSADPTAVRAQLERSLPADVVVRTKTEELQQERDYWKDSTPIGFIFQMGTVIGFVVGVVICYQILATDIADHLAEFATLKAIGYHNRFLSRIVLEEALILSVIGFVPGLAATWLLYAVLKWQTGLPMDIQPARCALILVLTIVMCILSAAIAVRKVQAADPAEVF